MKTRITTLAGLRRKVRKLIAETDAKWQAHKRESQRRGWGSCLSSCEDAQEYHHRSGALAEVLRAAGGRP